MSSLIVVDDNELDWLIVNYNLRKYSKFNTVSYYSGGMPFVDFITQNANKKENLPDAVFLDLNMPLFNGWDVLNAMKKIYPTLAKKIKVYIVTSSINPADILRSKGFHFVRQFISKPFTKENILEIAV